MHDPYAGKFRVTRTYQQHLDEGDPAGIDYGMDEGTPLYAPCSGALYFFENDDAGFDCVIYQPDGSSERVCHNIDNELARSLHQTLVAEGDHVSYSGNTGNSTGPHAHCNGWTKDGTRRPPFYGATISAGSDTKPITQEKDEDMANISIITDNKTGTIVVNHDDGTFHAAPGAESQALKSKGVHFEAVTTAQLNDAKRNLRPQVVK